MKMFGRTIELQPGHPGVEEPHYMLHIYFKPDGKVLFGTDAQSAFDPEGACPEASATASASARAGASFAAAASSTATASATASPGATASSASALPEAGGAFSLTELAALALLMVGTGILAFNVVHRG
jgi:hypothetical protein